jgi:hypothetical protein
MMTARMPKEQGGLSALSSLLFEGSTAFTYALPYCRAEKNRMVRFRILDFSTLHPR